MSSSETTHLSLAQPCSLTGLSLPVAWQAQPLTKTTHYTLNPDTMDMWRQHYHHIALAGVRARAGPASPSSLILQPWTGLVTAYAYALPRRQH